MRFYFCTFRFLQKVLESTRPAGPEGRMWGASDFLFSSSLLHGCVVRGGKLSLACVLIACVQAVGSGDAPQDRDRHPHSLLQAAFQVGFALPQLSR